MSIICDRNKYIEICYFFKKMIINLFLIEDKKIFKIINRSRIRGSCNF